MANVGGERGGSMKDVARPDLEEDARLRRRDALSDLNNDGIQINWCG